MIKRATSQDRRASARRGRDRIARALRIDSIGLVLLASIALAAPSADALIIDIDATAHDVGSPLLVFLSAGTYSVTPVGIAGGGAYDAWNPWGATSCATPSGCAQTIPTTEEGWKNAYDVISDALTAVSVSGVPLSPVASQPSGPASLQDYWIASGSQPDQYHVDDATVYPTAADAFAAGESSVFTVSAPGQVGFSIRDGTLGDNLGGMSLEILPIPEPSTAPLLGLGLALLGIQNRIGRARRR